MPNNQLFQSIQQMYPGYFALVMATGIISIACSFLQFPYLPELLFWLNNLFFVCLVLLLILRIIFFFSWLAQDITSHAEGAGFFTLVAGSCVLGSQYKVLGYSYEMASALWLFALFVWILITYTFFTSISIKQEKPGLGEGINGSWLIIIVGTQSISILGALLSSDYSQTYFYLLFFSLLMYLLGCMLYILIITLIFYRMVFFKLDPRELTPPYWINMGAVAITTMAGATLILQESQWEFLQQLDQFLKGFTLLFWITATWWIPLLIILGMWRHFWKKISFEYKPHYWGMVFPLGMYTASTYQLSEAINLSFLKPIPQIFIYFALLAWFFTFVGLIKKIWVNLF